MSNCAFDINKRDCAALKKKQCVGGHFRKTAEELEAGREKARELLKKLTPQERASIKERYKVG